MNVKKIAGWMALVVVIIAGIIGYRYYQAINGPNLQETGSSILYIYPGTTMDSLRSDLDPHLISVPAFEKAAGVMRFEEKDIKTGRYDLTGISSNRQLINLLRSGRQAPVNVVIHNERAIEQVAGKISRYLLLDSEEIVECMMNSEKLQEKGFGGEILISLIIPNTYQMFWNISCGSLVDRLIREHEKFWTRERLDRADSIGLSPAEVYTLASIVDRETIAPREKPTVAGVYLNRLKKNMLLQADPTVVYANNILDTRRVLYKHLELDSPYNTYKYPGLPPGPIGIASISGIDAVLEAEAHDFIYMVAKPDNSGLHNFSSSLQKHNRHARAYQQWLNQRGI